jgi:hypothetical protein
LGSPVTASDRDPIYGYPYLTDSTLRATSCETYPATIQFYNLH